MDRHYRSTVVNLRASMRHDIDELRGDIPRSTLVHNLLALALKNDEIVFRALGGGSGDEDRD